MIRVDNYILKATVLEIINQLKITFPKNKLKDVKVSSNEIVVTCPNTNHANGNEKNPDGHINLKTDNNVPEGYYHCFACGEKCNFVGFVALYLDSNIDFAKQWLISTFGEKLGDTFELDNEISITKKQHISKKLDESILDSFQSWTPYLAKRHLDRHTCEFFKIKYDSYNRQVVFPIYDENNNLKMLATRSVDTKFFHMDENQEKEVYGLNVVLKNNLKTVFIVEGLIDMLTCWSNGIPAIATLGAISDYQIQKINNSCITNLYLCMDNDPAGRRFTEKLKAKVNDRIFKTEIFLPKNIKDVNELSSEQWKNLKNYYNLFEFYV